MNKSPQKCQYGAKLHYLFKYNYLVWVIIHRYTMCVIQEPISKRTGMFPWFYLILHLLIKFFIWGQIPLWGACQKNSHHNNKVQHLYFVWITVSSMAVTWDKSYASLKTPVKSCFYSILDLMELYWVYLLKEINRYNL